MGGGGGAVYLYQMPKTWKELLVKEGFVFLNTEEEYKGMFHDQKDTDSWKNETEVKDSKEGDVKAKAEGYCSKKLQEKLPNSSDSDYSTTKQKLISFCTTEGITTVKGRLIQSNQSKWIAEENSEDKWKAVFAVYRYNNEFINWLKKDSAENSGLSSTSNVSEYTKLKAACSKLLKKSHKEITNQKYFNYGSWWCVELGYDTIEDKIKRDDKNWSVKEQNDSDWNTLKTKWESTEQVSKWVKDPTNGNSNSSDDLTEDKFKTLCSNTHVKAKLSEEKSYQEKYLVIKTVCKKEVSAG